LDKALEHLKINWLAWKNFKSNDVNLVGTKTREMGKTSLFSKIYWQKLNIKETLRTYTEF
jgi:hypothetical protein